MTYYAFIQDNKINGCGECRQLTQGVVNYEITEEIFNNIQDYIWNGSEVVIDPELDAKKLQQAKEEKIIQNDFIRDEALNQGIVYKGVLFDSDTDQKVNLLAIVSTIGDEQVITWFGKDNQPLECTKEDLINIGSLITQLHTFCWGKNALLKSEISNAETIEELEEIEIDYTLPVEGGEE